jgi:hypothetical protein
MQKVKLTETRFVALGKINSNPNWFRKDGRTFNIRTNRKMAEPTYWWLIEKKLITNDGGQLSITDEGATALLAHITRS